jgi:hypothetical protein
MEATHEQFRTRRRKAFIAIVVILLPVLYFWSYGPVLYAVNRYQISFGPRGLAAMRLYFAPREWALAQFPWLRRITWRYDAYFMNVALDQRGVEEEIEVIGVPP